MLGESRQIRASRPADPVYLARFEAERAAVLRRRMVWCLYILLGLLAVSFVGAFYTVRDYVGGRISLHSLAFLMLQDIALTALAVAALVYLLADRPDRRRLVRGVTVFTIIATGIAVYFEARENLIEPNTLAADERAGVADPQIAAVEMALFSMSMLVALPLVLIPMRLAESVRIALGCAAAYAVITFVVARAPIADWGAYAGMALVIPLVPMAYSHWRYLRFDAQFQHKDLAGRFDELSAELTQARKLHEALFPAPVTEGPVRIGYAYEPMREIGGDFVYVHPGGAGEEGGARFIVLVDVSGHGVAAALAVHRLHDELRRIFAAAEEGASGREGDKGEVSARDIIADLNRYVHAALAPQAVFATAICVRLEPIAAKGHGVGVQRWTMEWCNAGHPPAALRSGAAEHGEQGTIHWLEPTATMLGVLEPELYEPAARTMPVVVGDRLIAYTDGLIETRDAGGELFGVERVRETIAGGAVGGPLAETLMRTVGAYRAGRATDDVLVVEASIAGVADAERAPHSGHGAPDGVARRS